MGTIEEKSSGINEEMNVREYYKELEKCTKDIRNQCVECIGCPANEDEKEKVKMMVNEVRKKGLYRCPDSLKVKRQYCGNNKPGKKCGLEELKGVECLECNDHNNHGDEFTKGVLVNNFNRK